MRIGVYPGSFDPFTEGHLDILNSAVPLFDKVVVGVLCNAAKKPVFTAEERVDMIRRVVEDREIRNVEIASFNGLLVDFAKSLGATNIIRGLRATTDFEYEFQIGAINRHLAPDIQTLYFMANPAHSFLSSSGIKEIGMWGGCIDGLVPACIAKTIAERLRKP